MITVQNRDQKQRVRLYHMRHMHEPGRNRGKHDVRELRLAWRRSVSGCAIGARFRVKNENAWPFDANRPVRLRAAAFVV